MTCEEDDFPDTLVQEMEFPLERGCTLHVSRRFCDTDDEKFICRLECADGTNMFMPDPDDGFQSDSITVYSSTCVAELIQAAQRYEDQVSKDLAASLIKNGIRRITRELIDNA